MQLSGPYKPQEIRHCRGSSGKGRATPTDSAAAQLQPHLLVTGFLAPFRRRSGCDKQLPSKVFTPKWECFITKDTLPSAYTEVLTGNMCTKHHGASHSRVLYFVTYLDLGIVDRLMILEIDCPSGSPPA